MSPDDYNSLADYAALKKDLLLKNSARLVKPTRKNKKCGKVFIKLPYDVKTARSRGNVAFYSLKLLNYPLESDIHETYRASCKEYRQNCVFFSTNVKLIKLLSSVTLQSQMKNYFGNLLEVNALHLR